MGQLLNGQVAELLVILDRFYWPSQYYKHFFKSAKLKPLLKLSMVQHQKLLVNMYSYHVMVKVCLALCVLLLCVEASSNYICCTHTVKSY